MLETLSHMFQDMDFLLQGLNKKSYQANMENYIEKYNEYFDEIYKYVGEAEDKSRAADIVAEKLCNQVMEAYAKKGKLGKSTLMNLNFTMVYYVFPALLLRQEDNSKLIVKSLRDGWNKFFKENINYTTYDELLAGFKSSIFGVPIG